jgi:hypothetical protein
MGGKKLFRKYEGNCKKFVNSFLDAQYHPNR